MEIRPKEKAPSSGRGQGKRARSALHSAESILLRGNAGGAGLQRNRIQQELGLFALIPAHAGPEFGRQHVALHRGVIIPSAVRIHIDDLILPGGCRHFLRGKDWGEQQRGAKQALKHSVDEQGVTSLDSLLLIGPWSTS